MSRVICIARALGDEARVRAVLALKRSELCGCQLVEVLEVLGLATSTISKRMAILLCVSPEEVCAGRSCT